MHAPPTPRRTENWQRYICDYQFDGSTWGVEIVATSFVDAAARLRAIGMTGAVHGPIGMTIKMPNSQSMFWPLAAALATAAAVASWVLR